MKLILGLGNPGRDYDRTRHNAGFMAVDELARRHAPIETAKARFQAATVEARVAGEKCLLIKPTTFMNLSGRSAGEALRFFKLDAASDLIVIVDDLALPVGHIRVRAKGGSGGHNGLTDIDQRLGGQPYPRVRVGIGAVPSMMSQVDWVLSRFAESEQADLEQSLKKAADAVEVWVADGVDAAMNKFNEKASGQSGKPGRKAEKPANAGPTDRPAQADTRGKASDSQRDETADIDRGWLAG